MPSAHPRADVARVRAREFYAYRTRGRDERRRPGGRKLRHIYHSATSVRRLFRVRCSLCGKKRGRGKKAKNEKKKNRPIVRHQRRVHSVNICGEQAVQPYAGARERNTSLFFDEGTGLQHYTVRARAKLTFVRNNFNSRRPQRAARSPARTCGCLAFGIKAKLMIGRQRARTLPALYTRIVFVFNLACRCRLKAGIFGRAE